MMTGGVDYVSMGTIYEDAHNEAKDKLDQIEVGPKASLGGLTERARTDAFLLAAHQDEVPARRRLR